MGSKERAIVSICVSCATISDGDVRRRLNLSSRMIERSVGSAKFSVVPIEVLRIDLSDTLGFFANMRRSALPYFRRRRLRAFQVMRRVVFLNLLKQPWDVCRVVVPVRLGSGRVKRPRVSKSSGGGLMTVRRDIGVLTLDQRDGEGASGGGNS